MKKESFLLGAMILLICSSDARAQCGADGLSPCVTAPVAAKAVVKKAGSVKKAAVSEVEKNTPKSVKSVKSNKNSRNDTSLYNSLKLNPKKASVKSGTGELFPLGGVTLGSTTERQMRILGGERKVFTDFQTGEQRIYYTVAKRSFWLRDGVADSVGFFSVQGMPAQWQRLGLNFGMSLNEAAQLFTSLGYEVNRSGILQKLEDIGTNKTYSARVTAAKNGETPILIGMEFTLGDGKNADSPNTAVYFAARVKH